MLIFYLPCIELWCAAVLHWEAWLHARCSMVRQGRLRSCLQPRCECRSSANHTAPSLLSQLLCWSQL